eukprot:SAG31_NODE_6983_length_1826_cov_5.171395_2_plen_124_part_00
MMIHAWYHVPNSSPVSIPLALWLACTREVDSGSNVSNLVVTRPRQRQLTALHWCVVTILLQVPQNIAILEKNGVTPSSNRKFVCLLDACVRRIELEGKFLTFYDRDRSGIIYDPSAQTCVFEW